MAFAILQEQAGRQHWVRINGPGSETFTTAILAPPKDLQYLDHDTAERDAGVFRERNNRKYKEEPPLIPLCRWTNMSGFLRGDERKRLYKN